MVLATTRVRECKTGEPARMSGESGRRAKAISGQARGRSPRRGLQLRRLREQHRPRQVDGRVSSRGRVRGPRGRDHPRTLRRRSNLSERLGKWSPTAASPPCREHRCLLPRRLLRRLGRCGHLRLRATELARLALRLRGRTRQAVLHRRVGCPPLVKHANPGRGAGLAGRAEHCPRRASRAANRLPPADRRSRASERGPHGSLAPRGRSAPQEGASAESVKELPAPRPRKRVPLSPPAPSDATGSFVAIGRPAAAGDREAVSGSAAYTRQPGPTLTMTSQGMADGRFIDAPRTPARSSASTGSPRSPAS
jgi:hypothetical protein